MPNTNVTNITTRYEDEKLQLTLFLKLLSSQSHNATLVLQEGMENTQTHVIHQLPKSNPKRTKRLTASYQSPLSPDIEAILKDPRRKLLYDRKGDPTDAAHSLFIIDLDRKPGSDNDGIESFKNIHNKFYFGDASYIKVRTKNGGYHLVFKTDNSFLTKFKGTSQDAILPGIDLKYSNPSMPDLNTWTPLPGQSVSMDGQIKRYHIVQDDPSKPQYAGNLPGIYKTHLLKTLPGCTIESSKAFDAKIKAMHEGQEEDLPRNIAAAETFIDSMIAKHYSTDEEEREFKESNRNNYIAQKVVWVLLQYNISESNALLYTNKFINAIKSEVAYLDETEIEIIVSSAYSAIHEKKQHLSKTAGLSFGEDDVTPFGEIVTFKQLISTLSRIPPTTHLSKLLVADNGMRMLGLQYYIVEGVYHKIDYDGVEILLTKANELLDSNYKIELKNVTNLLHDYGIQISSKGLTHNSMCAQLGNTTMKSTKSEAQIKVKIVDHPDFSDTIRRGLSLDSNRLMDNEIFIKGNYISTQFPSMMKICYDEMPIDDGVYDLVKPQIEKQLEIFKSLLTSGDEDTRNNDWNVIRHSAAAAIQNINFPLAILLEGPEGSGKSTFLYYMSMFFSPDDIEETEKIEDYSRPWKTPRDLTIIHEINPQGKDFEKLATVIKDKVTNDTPVAEEKGKNRKRIRVQPHLWMATNNQCDNTSFLRGRRNFITKGSMVFSNISEIRDHFDSFSRELLKDDALLMRAHYRYWREITVDNNLSVSSSRYQIDLANSIEKNGLVIGTHEEEHIAKQQQKITNIKERNITERALMTMYANGGMMPDGNRISLASAEENRSCISSISDWNIAFKWFFKYIHTDDVSFGDIVHHEMSAHDRLDTRQEKLSYTRKLTDSIIKGENGYEALIKVTGQFENLRHKLTLKCYTEKTQRKASQCFWPEFPFRQWIGRIGNLYGVLSDESQVNRIVEDWGLTRYHKWAQALTHEPNEQEIKDAFDQYIRRDVNGSVIFDNIKIGTFVPTNYSKEFNDDNRKDGENDDADSIEFNKEDT